ncbi:MAG: hypothetical protein JHC61_11800 [Burkholderiaceae bacterium]|nr:hypothetical protein [Burkholderiaceae bacterium]
MDGKIKRGKILNAQGKNDDHGAVSLTTDPTPKGHGLPNGCEITDQQDEAFGYVIKINEKKYCADHTAYRIQIIPDGLNLIPAIQYYKNNLLLLRTLAATAFFPLGDAKDPKNRPLVDSLVLNPHFLGKGRTWWYCMHDVPETKVVAVAGRIAGTEKYKNLTKPEILVQLKALSQT